MKTLQDKQRTSRIAPSISSLVLITLATHGVSAQTNTFPPNGKAGVGTIDPASALHVVANDPALAPIRVRNTADTGFSGIEYERGNDGVVTAYVGLDSTNGFFRLNSLNNHPFAFLTENIERMRITSNGNVGIGTSTPRRKLDVRGDINTSSQYMIDGSIVLSTVGQGNLFVGEGVGQANTSGQDNAFFGRAAANANTTGSNNAFFGRSAGNGNTTGEDNSFFGSIAGNANETGSGNSFFGRSAGRENTSGASNSFFGRSAGLSNRTGTSNAFFGGSAGRTNRGGNANTIIGFNADVASESLSFATAIGANAVVSTNNTIVLGRPNGQDTVRIPGLGIGGNATLCRNFSTQISTCASSLRYKRDIIRFSGGLDLVRQLRPISFRWKVNGISDVGFGAEDVARIAPLFVTHNTAGEIEGVKYSQLTAVLVNAIQEQQAELEAKDSRIADLEARLAALERLVLSNPQTTAQQATHATLGRRSAVRRAHERRH